MLLYNLQRRSSFRSMSVAIGMREHQGFAILAIDVPFSDYSGFIFELCTIRTERYFQSVGPRMSTFRGASG